MTPTPEPVTEDMTERVARAIADKRNEVNGLPPAYWSDGEWNGTDLVLTPYERDLYRALATAAIAALNTETARSGEGELRRLLQEFASQKTTAEQNEYERASGDYEGAYDVFIKKSREALSTEARDDV
jgi:hypothetical protein